MTRFLISISLISSSMLAYELLLMRSFSISQWHHFAYMIISIALLGFGASGSFISLCRNWLQKRFQPSYQFFGIGLCCSYPLCFLISQKIPFDPFLIIWDRRQYIYLFEHYLTLIFPFFFGATCIGLSFLKFKEHINRVYFFDLVGSGLGTILAVFLMYRFPPSEALIFLAIISLFATIIVIRRNQIVIQGLMFLIGILVCGLFLYFPKLLKPNISEYKGLRVTMNLPKAQILEESFSPLAQLNVVTSPAIRHAPGLSLAYTGKIPPQVGIFIDADSMSAIANFNGDSANLEYLDYLSSSLPYHLLEPPKVLILGAGGGADVLAALYHRAKHITAVELNPQIIALVRHKYAAFANRIYSDSDPNVKIESAEARGFIRRGAERYDLIQVSLIDSFSASASGVYALNESYLYTVEALEEYISRLTPNGILAITRWLKLPPRDEVKLSATAVEALQRKGVTNTEVSRRIVMIRSWATATLLVKNSPFTEDELKKVEEFCQTRLFDPIYYPNIKPEATNRYNVIAPIYGINHFQIIEKILFGSRNLIYAEYVFNIRPATDDKPYFFNFFRWKALPRLLKSVGREWIPFVEWGYIILIATLIQAIIASAIFVMLPLFKLSLKGIRRKLKLTTFVYFLCLGLGFMFIEMAFIQKFALFLSHPIYAISVVLSSFLIFAGLGSLSCKKVGSVLIASLGIGLIALTYIICLGRIFDFFISYSDPIRIAISVALIAPLAFFMGMPFPLGLSWASKHSEALVAWAWGINGCASVISAVGAICLAISVGFNLLVLIAVIGYLVASISQIAKK